ncbi:MAG: hypothetical protein NTV92_03780, partial [Candidatus Bipolaricaulota bacterium]|nr:hypothetical protein [Candidatus Bipolaricaulota bacterium]
PRLALSGAAFEKTDAPVLLIEGDTLVGKDADGDTWRLELTSDGFRYADAHLSVRLTSSLRAVAIRVLQRGLGTRSTARAIEGAVLWRGLRESPAWSLVERSKGEL